MGVYFRGERLGTGHGRSIQQAEMNAAACALDENGGMYNSLQHYFLLPFVCVTVYVQY